MPHSVEPRLVIKSDTFFASLNIFTLYSDSTSVYFNTDKVCNLYAGDGKQAESDNLAKWKLNEAF